MHFTDCLWSHMTQHEQKQEAQRPQRLRASAVVTSFKAFEVTDSTNRKPVYDFHFSKHSTSYLALFSSYRAVLVNRLNNSWTQDHKKKPETLLYFDGVKVLVADKYMTDGERATDRTAFSSIERNTSLDRRRALKTTAKTCLYETDVLYFSLS